MTTNPYAAPRAAVADEASAQGEFVPGGRTVLAANGWTWIADGWTLFKAAPGTWIGIVVVLLLILVVLALIPFLGSLATSLLFPVFTGGIVIGCRALDEGGRLEFNHLFDGFKTNFGTLIAVGALYLAAWVVIFVVTMVIVGAGAFALFMGGGGASDPAIAGKALTTIALAVLIMLGLSVPVLMAFWFAPPLVVFHNLGAIEAMKQSFSGCLRNLMPFLVYGIVGMLLAIVASIPILLGWLVLGPVIAASIYTSYKDIYLR
ncbi:MAG: hypothetical protein QOD26_2343 [Betaproteobacteria bacterium]|jgi:uncharacterized membrane protein|nr:hypothetical protein [Betaproteobacteria bacterium]